MPQFKIAKTDNKSKLMNKNTNEDTLYILKESESIGKLYFDYKNGKRLEIGTSENVYEASGTLTEDIVTIPVRNLKQYNSDETFTTLSDTNSVQINSLVVNQQSLYNIRNIDRNKNTITLRRIYKQKNLTWEDCY